MTKRIWELDALRGLCIVGMVIVHLLYDLVNLYGLPELRDSFIFRFLTTWGGIPFVVISGICVTFTGRATRRGALVFSFGMVCTAVTAGMYILQLAGREIIIWFGVLHCLGICMLLWPLFKKLPVPALAVIGAAIIALGLYIKTWGRVEIGWLFPLGIMSKDFASSDYYPLLPNLGYFLVGAAIGRSLYRDRQTLLPGVNAQALPIRFLRLCGRQSLPIYLLHQVVLTAAFWLLNLFL